MLKSMYDEIRMAVEKGTAAARNDLFMTRIAALDDRGRRELVTVLHKFKERAIKAQRESSKRLAKSGDKAIPATLFLFSLCYEDEKSAAGTKRPEPESNRRPAA